MYLVRTCWVTGSHYMPQTEYSEKPGGPSMPTNVHGRQLCFVLYESPCIILPFYRIQTGVYHTTRPLKNNLQLLVHLLRSMPVPWLRGLRRRSVAARLLRLWVRIPLEAWMSICCECCVLSGSGFCDELITRPEESYRLWCVVACDLETS